MKKRLLVFLIWLISKLYKLRVDSDGDTELYIYDTGVIDFE